MSICDLNKIQQTNKTKKRQYISCCLVLGGSHSASTLRRFLTSLDEQLLIVLLSLLRR